MDGRAPPWACTGPSAAPHGAGAEGCGFVALTAGFRCLWRVQGDRAAMSMNITDLEVTYASALAPPR